MGQEDCRHAPSTQLSGIDRAISEGRDLPGSPVQLPTQLRCDPSTQLNTIDQTTS